MVTIEVGPDARKYQVHKDASDPSFRVLSQCAARRLEGGQ